MNLLYIVKMKKFWRKKTNNFYRNFLKKSINITKIDTRNREYRYYVCFLWYNTIKYDGRF